MPQEPVVFLGVVALLTITPGADMAMVARSVFSGGRSAAFATTLGISAGCFAWAVASAIGIAAVLAASQTAYDALRLVGAAYLVWLGLQSLVAAWHGVAPPAEESASRRRSPFRQGLLTNLLNPKVAVFFIALLPQFVPASASVLDHVLLAMVAATVTLVWFVTLANIVSTMRRVLTRARVRRAVDAVMGTLLVGLGVRVAISS
jgi:threonine/homoserine/homoserine lactone efflux protein